MAAAPSVSRTGAPAPPARPRTASAAAPLSLARKVAYGVGEVVVGTRLAALAMVLFPFYTDVALLPPALVGAALALGRIWDGVNDPVTGWLSDRTRTRFGIFPAAFRSATAR